MQINDPDVIVEQDFPCSQQVLWRAITDPAQMRQWFFDNIPNFEPRVGFKTEFTVDAGERQFLHQWNVTEVEPQKKLVYRWRYSGYAGTGRSVFELAGDDEFSQLRINFVVEEDFAADIPEFQRAACLGGWQYFIAELGRYLATR
jgi:uncharacterized protein YndB with AHSA1/START domain